MTNDSPFARLKEAKPQAVSGFPFTYVMFCDFCKHVWKTPQPPPLEAGGTGFKCPNCKDENNTARCLVYYENDAPRI